MNEERFGERELLQEEITDRELRELLQRLGQEEFEGSGKTRVADLMEATGASLDAVAGHLADIRRGDWEAKFGRRQDVVERRVDRHENVLKKHGAEIKDLRQGSPGRARISDREIHTAVQREEGRQAAVTMAVIGIILAFGYVFMSARAPHPTVPTNPSLDNTSGREETLQLGEDEFVKRNGKWVNRRTGAESTFAEAFAANVDKGSNRSQKR